MPFLESTRDNADQLFAVVIAPDFFLHRIEVVDEDPASGSLNMLQNYIQISFKVSVQTL